MLMLIDETSSYLTLTSYVFVCAHTCPAASSEDRIRIRIKLASEAEIAAIHFFVEDGLCIDECRIRLEFDCINQCNWTSIKNDGNQRQEDQVHPV